jgi:hypothetical protein
LDSDDRPSAAYPFYAEEHFRRERPVLRPVVRLSIGDQSIVVGALVDTGSEHVFASSDVALSAGLDVTDPIDTEQLGLGGRSVTARFVRVPLFLHPADDSDGRTLEWEADVGFIDSWHPLYPCILGNVGFLDQFTVTVSRFAQATAVERVEEFDNRFGTGQWR